MKKELKSLCIVTALILSGGSLPVSAESDIVTYADVLLQIREKQLEKKQYTYTPIRPSENHQYYNYTDLDEFIGIAVLSQTGLEGVRKHTDYAAPLAQYRKSLSQTEFAYQSVELILPENLTAESIICCDSTDSNTVRELYLDPDITILGTVNCHTHEKNIVIDPSTFYLKPADNAAFQTGDIIKGDSYQLHVDAVEENHIVCWCDSADYYTSDSDAEKQGAEALCEVLEARSDIEYAWLMGESWMGWERTDATISVIPIEHNSTGDADGDCDIDLQDASAVLKQYNVTDILSEDGFMTDEQIAAADVDGDSAVTPKDASCIQIFINFADILEEPKTWAEIIKK